MQVLLHSASPPATPPSGIKEKVLVEGDQRPSQEIDGGRHSNETTSEKRKASSSGHMEIPAEKKIREQSVDSIEMSPLSDPAINLESVDGKPQPSQQHLLGSSRKIGADLNVTAPEGTPLTILQDNLNKTMEDEGVSV